MSDRPIRLKILNSVWPAWMFRRQADLPTLDPELTRSRDQVPSRFVIWCNWSRIGRRGTPQPA
ncbi:hypothetical protein [Pannonibacter phragmitetus]|jgi:hypothetical protein|uniref:hypothetical protein n=1 Tax=Pannonibacter phragmitetus TaxID=121719 RepID=UPI001981750C|nr:hypothetical protein [Pannonibacter phragmitetus]